jgi:translation initiation factor IF-3
VIGSEGENVGVLKTPEAIKLAQEKDLDLIVVAEKSKPPVAKILDYNKFLYDEKKKVASSKAKSKKSELKELRFGPLIGKGDFDTKLVRAKKFLGDGDRVRVSVVLKGRENAHPEIGFEKLANFIKELEEVARTEAQPKKVGNTISVTFVSN